MDTVTLNGVEYIRKDSVVTTREIGDVRIIVADKGFVFVGNCEENGDGSVTIRNCRNIRRWGTTKGVGQLATGPTANTVHDEFGTVRVTPIVQIAVVSGW